MGAVILAGSREYAVTDEDRLWLLRAVAREGRDSYQVAQCLVNGFAYVHSKHPKACPTLRWWVQSYAQPVNPRWFPEGAEFKKWHARDAQRYTLIAAKRRQHVYAKATHFSRVVESAVDRALGAGPVNIPPSATDYAASWIDASRKYVALTEPRRGFNRLWSRAPKWGGYRVSAVEPA